MQRKTVLLFSFYAYIFQDLNTALLLFFISPREDSKCKILNLNANVILNVTEGS